MSQRQAEANDGWELEVGTFPLLPGTKMNSERVV